MKKMEWHTLEFSKFTQKYIASGSWKWAGSKIASNDKHNDFAYNVRLSKDAFDGTLHQAEK